MCNSFERTSPHIWLSLILKRLCFYWACFVLRNFMSSRRHRLSVKVKHFAQKSHRTIHRDKMSRRVKWWMKQFLFDAGSSLRMCSFARGRHIRQKYLTPDKKQTCDRRAFHQKITIMMANHHFRLQSAFQNSCLPAMSVRARACRKTTDWITQFQTWLAFSNAAASKMYSQWAFSRKHDKVSQLRFAYNCRN